MKNKSTLFALPFCLLISFSMTFAQDIPEFLPKSPEAVAMDKFMDIPPGSYTGVAGYSVPLYTIEVDGYSIPITINYHGSGIKVNEVASSVGLGWSVSVGGISLSRQVIGEDDLATNPLSIDVSTFYPVPVNSQDYIYATNMVGYNSPPGTPIIHELQPDYFSYSLLHNSGKFILDNMHDAQTVPKDDVKIIDDNGTTLIDNHGITYNFIPQYTSFSVTGTSSGGGASYSPRNIPSYILDQIIFPSGKTVSFSYLDSVHDYIASHNENQQRLVNNNSHCSSIQNNISRTTYFMEEKVLSQITYDNAQIDFIYDTNAREDIGGKKLNQLQVKSLIGGVSQTIKDYTFTHSYTEGSGTIDPPVNPLDPLYDGLIKRLQLEGVEETLSDKSYTFDYYDDYNGKNLPNRLSKDTDFWGLYNGKNNQSYIHQYTYNDNNGDLRVEEGADKNPDLNYAQIGSLKTVRLPTGGTQEFEYELDDYKVDAIVNQFFKREYLISVNGNTVYNQPIPINLSGLDYRDGFGYALEFYWEGNPNQEGDLPNISEPYYGVKLSHSGNSDIQTLYNNLKVDLEPFSQSQTYYLNFIGNPPVVPENVWAKLTWYQNNPQYVDNKKVGSLRIKSIILKDSDGTTALQRNYRYRHPIDTAFSSAKFRDFDKSFFTESPGGTQGGHCRYINYSNNYDVNTSAFKGKSVVYEYVEETYVNSTDSLENYTILKQFSLPTIFDQPQPGNLPKLPFIDESYTGGLLLSSKVKKSNGDVLSETTNVYASDNHFNADSYNNQYGAGSNALSGGIAINLKAVSINPGGSITFEYNWNPYYYPSTWVKLMETTTKTYFGNEEVEETTTFGYDPSYRHIRPVSETTHSSTEQEIKTVYQYPQELLGEPHASDLIATNRIAVPLVTSHYRESTIGLLELTTKQRTEYKDWGNGIIEPQTLEVQKSSSNATEDRIVYYDYDDNGNPLEVSKADGTHIVYIWGYDNTLPIAKIENAIYSDVLSQVANLETKSNEDNDRTLGYSGEEGELRQALDSLRTSLPDAMVTTYTYDPLVGVTSITDPRGYTTYYHYDDFNRLEYVKDANGNILSENEYNYRPQPQN